MSQYLTYEEYTGYGGAKTEEDFTPLEFKARKAIDYMTDCRVQNMAEVPEAVKLCMYSIINIIAVTGAEAQADNPQVTSFNTDGYSETYGNAMTAEQSEQAVFQSIRTLLYGEYDDNGVPLLYRGVDRG